VTAASGFKRLGIGLGVIVAALAVAFAAIAILMPVDILRDSVRAEIRGMTGLDPLLRGESSVSIFPNAAVSFEKVALGGDTPAQTALKADRVVAHLRLFPLLFGHVEISDVTLVNPTIALTFSTDGRSNWSTLLEKLAAQLQPTAAKNATVSEILLEHGTILVRDESRQIDEQLHDVNLALAWPSISKTFAATGQFNWHGEPVDASVTLADFLATLDGKPSGLKVRLSGAPIKLAFEGHVSARPTFKIDGTIATDSPSLRNAVHWVGLHPLPHGGFGKFALKSKLLVTGGTVSFSAANIELDGNAAEGVITFASDGRQTVQGTLAADTLNLSPYVSTIRLMTDNERDWDPVPMTLDSLNAFDLDLRISAAKVAIAGATLGRTAIAANMRGGSLTVSVGEAQAFGGLVQGSFGLAKSANGGDFKAQLQFADVDLDRCLGALFGLHKLEGTGTLGLILEGSGDSVLGITRTLTGSAKLAARKGAIVGLNLEQLLQRLERRPLSGGGDYRNGKTPFDKLDVALKMEDGTVTTQTAVIDGPAVKLAVGGSASVPERDLDLKGTASLVASKPGDDAPFELPFMVRGSWDSPLMLLDSQALIRRAPAAAPLLDALRDRHARDSVRSAIERLVGAPPKPAANGAPSANAENKSPESN
jgi:AsmA protein